MKDDRLEIGDRVRVDVNNAQITVLYNAELLHIPVATGDSWIFQPLNMVTDEEEYGVVYISEGCTISYLGERK